MNNLNGKLKHVALAFIDAVLVLVALSLSVYLRFDWNVPTRWFERMENLLLPAVIITITVFFFFGIYRRVWRYAGLDDLLLIVAAVSTSLGGIYLYSLYSGTLPRSSYIIAWFLMVVFIGATRLAIRFLNTYLGKPTIRKKRKKVLIVGAGEAGVIVARELKKHGQELEMRVVGFIDDNENKQKQIIHGLPVLGTRGKLKDIVQEKNIKEIIIAIPSAPYSNLQEIITLCAELPVKIKTVPGIFEIVKGQVSISTIKEVEIEDLLRRLPVEQDLDAVSQYLNNEVVMVTGAGGSIGSELCRQIAQFGPEKIILLDHNENGIFYINLELSRLAPHTQVIPLVGDIQNPDFVHEVLSKYSPKVLFHAAAYKHVPLMETNPKEAIRNNIEGSKNLIDLAVVYGVKRFVFVSTDKAVNPSSVMGATKRVVEIYLQNKARLCNSCIFCSVRFGNVLGSQGSVVLLFKEQIARGGPVTVTHPEMKRYFMTIPEAVQLVIQAGALGKGGEIFVLDMGEPIRIVDLARDMIFLSGLKPDQDIKIEFTGIRPGEKLYEELFNDRENFSVTRHERIFIAPDTVFDDNAINEELIVLGNILGISTKVFDFPLDSS